MSTKRGRQKVKDLCKQYGVKCRIKRLSANGAIGWCWPYESRVVLEKHIKDDRLYNIVFHEIAHCLNYRNKKYARYHGKRYGRSLKYLRKFALRAEVYTDYVAKKLAKEHGHRYKNSYAFNAYNRKWLKEALGY